MYETDAGCQLGLKGLWDTFRCSLVVMISDSHSEGPGSIPGSGILFFIVTIGRQTACFPGTKSGRMYSVTFFHSNIVVNIFSRVSWSLRRSQVVMRHVCGLRF